MSEKQIRCTALMLAAGSGSRMKAGVRKQYLELGGMPLFLHSVRTMNACGIITDLVLVVPEGDEAYCRDLAKQHGADGKLRAICDGGAERFLSAAKGLEAVTWPCDYVFIHDCARPFLDEETIRRLFDAVQKERACVAGMRSKDTVRITDADGYGEMTPDRSNVWVVQTPQVFEYDLIREANRRLLRNVETAGGKKVRVTDDAMVVESMMHCRIRMVESSYRNIKVTTPEDLPLAEALLRDIQKE